MKALIRKPFHYATRDLLVGAIMEFPDAVFAELKRERLVTEAPPEELPLVMPALEPVAPIEPAPIAAPVLTPKPAVAPKRPVKSKRK